MIDEQTEKRRGSFWRELPILVGVAILVAVLVAVVVDASAAYLRRQGLNSAADAAALAATDGLQGDRIYTHGLDDLESPFPDGYPTTDALRENGWLPIPRDPLLFPSIVASSTNDPLGRFDRVCEFANAWGSRLENIGAVGHLNPAAGFGEWPQAQVLIRELAGEVESATDR